MAEENIENVEEQIEETTPAEPAETPAELQGLSEETIKEVMAEANAEAGDEDQGESETQEATEQAEHADEDSDNKPDGSTGLRQPKQKIPYERFKEKLDENKALKEQLEQMRAQIAAGAATTTQPQQQVPQAQTAPQAPQQPRQNVYNSGIKITPEVSGLISKAIKEQALAMSGLTEDDYEALEYMDDDDQRKIAYNQASKLAESNVYASITRAQAQRAANAQAVMQRHQQVVKSYNDFYNKEQAEPDYAEVVKYATGEYYEQNVPDADKMTITDAYTRIEKNIASPQDVLLIRRFYTDAKNAYRRKHGAAKQGSPTTKLAQSKAHPRSELINGSAAAGGIPSVDELARMMDDTPWEKIPDEYKHILMGD